MTLDIEQLHVNEAVRIVREFDNVQKNLDLYTDYTLRLKESIIKMKDGVDELMRNNIPDLQKQSILFEMINDHEKQINEEEKKIKPLLKQIEDLKSDSFKLYHILKDKYPGANDAQLKAALDAKIKDQLKNIKDFGTKKELN